MKTPGRKVTGMRGRRWIRVKNEEGKFAYVHCTHIDYIAVVGPNMVKIVMSSGVMLGVRTDIGRNAEVMRELVNSCEEEIE